MVKKMPKRHGSARPRLKVAEVPGQVVENKLEEELQRKRELRKEAIAAILEGIARPEMQNSLKPFILSGWSEKYKKDLGPYKQFLKENPKEFTIIDHDPCNFTVLKRGQAPKPIARKGKKEKDQALSWQKQLFKAWMMYCKVTPRDARDVKAFARAIVVAPGAAGAEAPAPAGGSGATGGGASAKVKGKRDGAAGGGGDGGPAPAAKAAKKRLAE
mmetsp:Transcript_111539/g.347688  ORF Transcript_111539/g.347688 Transcript_111539/m.347688 type:complete len:215 (+) Transcript_111539:183-827(+)